MRERSELISIDTARDDAQRITRTKELTDDERPGRAPKVTVRQRIRVGRADAVHRRRAAVFERTAAFILPLVLLLIWQVGASAGWIDRRFFSSPTDIWTRGVDLVRDGELRSELIISARRLVISYVLGSVVGVLLGLVLSQFRAVRLMVEPLLRALYVIPKLAVLPILLLVLGLGESPKILFVSLGVFYIMAFTTLSAAAMVPSAYHEAATVFGLSRLQRFRWVVLPGALPQIVAGLRLASGYGVLLVIAVEFLNGDDGLGYLTWHAWELFTADKMYVGIVTIAVFGLSFSILVGAIGRRLCPWSEE